MQLQEGLEELRGNILHDSSSLKVGPDDRYWTDEALVRYINDAHMRFARESWCIHDDTTPAVTRVVLRSGKDMYTLHSSVLVVLTARHQDDMQDLVALTHARVSNTTNHDTTTWDLVTSTVPGKPTAYTTDQGFDVAHEHALRMRFIDAPDATQAGKVVSLRTIRKPLKVLTTDDMDVEFELPGDYCLDMLEWAAWRALRNWDLDTEDRQKADKHRAQFDDATKKVKREVLRRLRADLKWQFGGGGFTYIHR